MRRALILTLLFHACAFEVNLGSLQPPPVTPSDGGSGGRGGGGGSATCSQPQLFAYEVTLAPTDLPSGCSFDAGAQLPEERFTTIVLVGSQSPFAPFPSLEPPTLALHGLAEQRLGDAPPIKLPRALSGADRVFEVAETITSYESVGGPAQVTNTTARFTFDRLDTPLTAGTLALESAWRCVPGADGGCPPALPFVTTCQLERRFLAERTTIPDAWAPRVPFEIPGTQQLVVSIDVSELLDEGRYCWGSTAPRLVQRHARGLRELERWQYDQPSTTLYVPQRTVAMGDAPAFTFGPVVNLAVSPEVQVVTSNQFPDATERRTTFAAVNATACTLSGGLSWLPQPVLVFQSFYACDGGGCPAVTSTDVGSCNPPAMPFIAVPLN